MANNEFNQPTPIDRASRDNLCQWCNGQAEVFLKPIDASSQHAGGIYCSECAEILVHRLRKLAREESNREKRGDAGLISWVPDLKDPVSRTPASAHAEHADDVDGGIVIWNGRAWESDGPFPGA